MKRLLFLFSILMGLTSVSFAQNANVLPVGDKAPVFKTLADDGNTWDVNDYIGKKYIVVYFYPAAMTGGCTKQACAYRDMKTEIESKENLDSELIFTHLIASRPSLMR